MATVGDLQFWVLMWLGVAGLLIVRHWRAGRNVGLLLAWVISFGAIDWFASALFLLPWNTASGFQFVTDGMRLSAIGMAAFAVGAETASWMLAARQHAPDVDLAVAVDSRVVNLYLAAGLFLHVAMAPIARSIPSVNAIVGAGSTLAVLAIALKCWNAWHEHRERHVWMWLIASAAFPIFTVVTQGFLGYGLSAMLMIVAFIATLQGPRAKVIIGAIVLGYLGLSVYVTYMRDREEIRSVVWSGGDMSDRIATVRETASQVEWFSLQNDAHLRRIDDRLNQNWLVGAAVERMSAGDIPFAKGQTLWDAVLAVVPRALWPTKSIVAGSGNLVSTYTGLHFDENTSIGIGQLMECYVNFGTPGVVIGFGILGALILLIDRRAVQWLHAGDPTRFVLWYLPGLNLLNVGGSFVEVTSSGAAAFLLAWGLRFLMDLWLPKTPSGSEVALASVEPATEDGRGSW